MVVLCSEGKLHNFLRKCEYILLEFCATFSPWQIKITQYRTERRKSVTTTWISTNIALRPSWNTHAYIRWSTLSCVVITTEGRKSRQEIKFIRVRWLNYYDKNKWTGSPYWRKKEVVHNLVCKNLRLVRLRHSIIDWVRCLACEEKETGRFFVIFGSTLAFYNQKSSKLSQLSK